MDLVVILGLAESTLMPAEVYKSQRQANGCRRVMRPEQPQSSYG